MTHILCIETATEICSISISDNDRCLICREDDKGNSHAEKIMQLIDESLRESGLKPKDLDAICVSEGPGSYTGLRIGTSTAKGLCYALSIPLISVSSLKGIANAAIIKHSEGNLFCPMIDAKRMEVYCAFYDKFGKCVMKTGNVILTPESFKTSMEKGPVVFCGNGTAKCKEIIYRNPNAIFSSILSSAAYLISDAYNSWKNKKFENVAYFEPFYLKEFITAKSHVKGLQ